MLHTCTCRAWTVPGIWRIGFAWGEWVSGSGENLSYSVFFWTVFFLFKKNMVLKWVSGSGGHLLCSVFFCFFMVLKWFRREPLLTKLAVFLMRFLGFNFLWIWDEYLFQEGTSFHVALFHYKSLWEAQYVKKSNKKLSLSATSRGRGQARLYPGAGAVWLEF